MNWRTTAAVVLMSGAMAWSAGGVDKPGAAGVELVKEGKTAAKVYVAKPTPEKVPTPGRGEKLDQELEARVLAVQELNYHLQKMTGATLAVVEVDLGAGDGAAALTAIRGPGIVLGPLAVRLGAKPAKQGISQEGIRLLTKGDLVLVGAESDRAALLGVYALLGKLGCDWVMPGELGEIIPTTPTLTVPPLDESQAPAFAVRRLWYRGYNQPRLPEESTRFYTWLRRQQGGNWTTPLSGAGGHVWDRFIASHKADFDQDPTMLALRRAPDGTLKRMGPQLEATHPRVIELFVADIKAAYADHIAKGEWTKDTVAAFGIGPADGLGYSLSAEAMLAGAGRVDPIVGEMDRTDELVLFGNRILAEVHKEYPNAHVGFYSYSTHADFPQRYKPNPMLVIIFAPINFSRLHGMFDANSKTQAYYRSVVEAWGDLHRAQGNPLFFRGYTWNLADNMLPYSKVRIWGEELPFYQQQGILGLNVEGTKMWSILAPSDYVFMKLAWDTTRDWQALLGEFCRKAFGAGAPAMERYYRRLIATQHGAGMEAGSYHAMPLIYDAAWVAAGEKDVAEARSAAQAPADQKRVTWLGQYQLDALRLYLQYLAAANACDFPATKTAYDAMHAQWKKVYDENTDLVANEAPGYLKRFIESYVTLGLKYTSEPYKLVWRVPDELPTMLDPNMVGDRMNYHRPELNDRGFVRTRTYGSTWDAQGLTGLRTGAVWYRVHFAVPAAAAGQPLGLFVGAVEDEARVWINGALVGTSGRGFSKPSVFDLTDGVKADGDNVLAIQVVRNSAANEIGLGGIIRPCFLFSGPRLETKAPKPLELRRVLPGGEEGAVEK